MAEEVKAGSGRFRVAGQAAVVRVLDGSERYLYKGAVFDAAQVRSDSVAHLKAVGLIAKVEKTAAEKKAEAEKKAAAEKAEADKAAAAKKAAEEKAAAEKAAADAKTGK